MHIRRAGIADYEHLCELIERFYRIDDHEFDAARIDGGLVPLLCDDAHGQVWVAADSDGLIGYKDCVLDELYVERRGSGHGGSLLQHAIEEARSAGAAAMFLETEAPNDGARRFYRRHGFAVEDSTWMSLAL
jgi:GNAT superfamily N-acetyltransferase